MTDAYRNLAVSTVVVSPGEAGVSLTVAEGHGGRFPVPPFNATVWPKNVLPDPLNAEIVRVTAIAGDVLTIERAQEGTTARAIEVDDLIANTLTKHLLDSLAASGQQILTGFGPPNSSTGVPGDFYIDTNTGTMYGPKLEAGFGPPTFTHPSEIPFTFNNIAFRVGHRYQAVSAGKVVGARFYRSANLVELTHTAFLYDTTNALVATSFPSVETADVGGWVEVAFPTGFNVAVGEYFTVVFDLTTYGFDTPIPVDLYPSTLIFSNGAYGPIGVAAYPGSVYQINYATDVQWQPAASSNDQWPVAIDGASAGAHAATHSPGGADALVNAAWVNSPNVFTLPQTLNSADPSLYLINSTQPVNERVWRMMNDQKKFVLFTQNDDGSNVVGKLYLHPDGMLQVPKVWLHGGGASPLSGTIKFGDGSGWKMTMGPDVPAGGERFTFTDNGNLDIYGKLTSYGGNLRERVTVGPSMGSGAGFNYSQFEVASGTGHPAMVWTDTTMPVDQQKARIAYYGAKLEFGFLNNGENAHTGTQVTISRAGLIAAAALSVTGDVNANILYGNAIHSYGTLHAQGALSAASTASVASTLNVSGKQTLFGGSGSAYHDAPLEIQMASYPRVGFHWPGLIASSLGMDQAGTIRTFDNPGTGYAAFACAAISSHGITCHAVNAGGGNVTCGTLNVSGQTWVGAIHSYGAANSASISTGGLVCTEINQQGYSLVNTAAVMPGGAVRIGNVMFHGDNPASPGIPYIRASNSFTHMVINGPTLYFNLDQPGNSIQVYGPMNCLYPLTVASITNSTGLAYGAYNVTDAGSMGNIYSIAFYQARWSRVGNVVTVSGQFDANTNPTGSSWARMYLPTYILQGGVTAHANGGSGIVVSSSGGETGYVNVGAGGGHADIIWMSNAGGLHGFFYHYTYSTN